MLKLFMEREFSIFARSKISSLFENINPDKKEELAEQIVKLIEQSQTEEEALETIQQMIQQIQ